MTTQPENFKINQSLILSEIFKKFCKLPEGIEFYNIDGQIIFPLRTVDPTSTDHIIYLIKKGDPLTGKGFYRYGVLLSNLFNPYVKDLLNNIDNSVQLQFDPDGGDLGTGDNK